MVLKIFTMVKDEVDIIKDWLIYHGSMFGWNNIYVIDNYSSDGTYEIINEFSSLINISRETDYTKKGDYMKELIKKYCNTGDLAFPIDIDEFIVYYDKKDNHISVSIDKDLIHNYINNLPHCSIYKSNYIYPLMLNENGYNRATTESEYGYYCDMGQHAKSFINTRYYTGNIDHGNHIVSHEFHLTKICLLHFHCRSLEQIKKKILNNIKGLGYHNNIEYLRDLLKNNKDCIGNHHVRNQIEILENTFKLSVNDINHTNNIDLIPFKNRILGGYF